MDIWATSYITYVPSGPAQAQSCIYYFHLTMGRCCVCPTLWLGGSGNTEFMMGSSDCIGTCWPISEPKAVSQRESSHLQRLAELCARFIGCALWFIYRGLAKAPNGISICHWNFKQHCVCWSYGPLGRTAYMLQTLLFLWTPLKTSGLLGHPVNGME